MKSGGGLSRMEGMGRVRGNLRMHFSKNVAMAFSVPRRWPRTELGLYGFATWAWGSR